MADTYGKLAIPLVAPTTETVTDPGLSAFADFLRAVLNARTVAAFRAVVPVSTGLVTQPGGLTTPVVKTVGTFNGEDIEFNEEDLPALYVDRTKGARPTWNAEDYRQNADTFRVCWVFEPAPQLTQAQRNSFTNGIVRTLERALEEQRDPAYVQVGDPNPEAATTAARPTALKLAVASTTTDQIYTGGALDGAVGGTLFGPHLLPTVTVAGDPASILDGSVVDFIGLGADGTARTSRVTLTTAGSPGTFQGDWNLTQIDQIEVEAQAGTAATLAFGLWSYAGKGSLLLDATGAQEIELASWSDKSFVVDLGEDGPKRTYAMVELLFDVVERLHIDRAQFDDAETRAQFTRSDGTIQEEAEFT